MTTIRRIALAALVPLLAVPLSLAAQVSVGAPLADSARAGAAPDTGSGPALRTSVEYQYIHFDTVFSDWQLASASLSARWKPVTAIGRVNYAHRFDASAWQFEGDLYPRFGRGYAYLSAAYSPDESFPEWRLGGEVFLSLPAAFEVSAGVRELRFEDDDVRIWTGSVGKYVGNYYTSVRPYVSDRDEGTATTVIWTTRRYLADADNYLGLSLGYGAGPVATSTVAEVRRGDSFRAGVEGVHTLRNGFGWQWNALFEREDLGDDGHRNRVGVGIGLRRDL
jgi:YaiO family outer membrane protein